MKRHFLLFCFILLSIMLGLAGKGSAAAKGKIIIYADRQVIKIPLSNVGGKLLIPKIFIAGGEEKIKIKKIVSANFNSDRTGWMENSAAVTAKKTVVESGGRKWLKMTIPHTFDNDWGSWTLKTASGFLWLNIDQFSYAKTEWVKDEDMIRYGNYQPPAISFAPDTAMIEFGCNGILGFVSPVFPEEVKEFAWNSNKVGWMGSSIARGSLQTDGSGHYFAVITGIPATDTGTFSVILNDGSLVWLNINGGWEYGPNVLLNQDIGQISYTN